MPNSQTLLQFFHQSEIMVKNSFPEFVKTSPIHRWTSEFLDTSEEQAYRQYNQPFQRIIFLVYLSLGLIAAPLSAIAVWPNIVGDAGALQTVIFHRALSVLCYGILMVISFRTANHHTLDRLVIYATVLIILNTYSIQEYSNPEGIGLVFRGIVIVLFSLAMFETRLSYFVVAYCCIIGTFSYQFLNFLELSQAEVWTYVIIFILLGVFGILYHWQNEKRRRVAFSLNSKLMKLHDELEIANKELLKQTQTDPLTGLGNRRAYDQRLITEAQRAQRYGTNYAVAIIDIDHFKDVNDNYGHTAGDLVLKAIAEILSAHSRAHELVARIGGEEFAIVFSQIELNDALVRLNSLREKIQQKSFQTGDATFSCTISAGISLSDGEQSLTQVHEAADKALYDAKNKGRDRIGFR